MGLGFGFDSGLRGLTAARMQMQLAGHNIANVGTQRLQPSESGPLQLTASDCSDASSSAPASM